MFDNTYIVDKLVQALVLAVIYWIIIDRAMVHFVILFGAAFLVMVSLDVFQGKVGYSTVPISSLPVFAIGSQSTTELAKGHQSTTELAKGSQPTAELVNQTPVNNSNAEKQLVVLKGGTSDQTRLCNAAPISTACRDPGENFLCNNFGCGIKQEVASYVQRVSPVMVDDHIYYDNLSSKNNEDEYCSAECDLSQNGVFDDTYHQMKQARNQLAGGRTPESTKFWDFGTFNFALDGTGHHHFRAAPYCTDNKIDMCNKHDPILGDPLKNDPVCLPCGMEGLSSELTQPLKDKIIIDGPYRECRENLTRIRDTHLLKPKNQTIVQSHYVPEYQGGPCQ